MSKKGNPMDELKKTDPKELIKQVSVLKKDLAHIQMDLKTGKEKQNHKVSALKKQIARIHTLNNQSTRSSNK